MNKSLSAPLTAVVVLGSVGLAVGGARAGGAPEGTAKGETTLPPSLKSVPIPEPRHLDRFVRDRAAAIRLGKALFWEMQAGSDGVQACASCHFHAGADRRLKNQLNPGTLGGDSVFEFPGAPNRTLTAADFPFRQLSNPDDRHSKVLLDRNDVASSQGVVHHGFQGIVAGSDREEGILRPDPVFHVGGVNVRRLEPRNTPTVFNAVFNFRNFWDGRAQNDFNGVNPFGSRDPDARVLRVVKGGIEPVRVHLENASLASQAVGPPLSAFEMSAEGRTFPHLGRKLFSLTPLAKQRVHPEDSVIGAIAAARLDADAPGLLIGYSEMIRAAFQPEWWASNRWITLDAAGRATFLRGSEGPPGPGEFTLMEANFALFWGLAIQLYQATLVADDTPFDRFLEGKSDVLTAHQRLGLELFLNKGKCINCHGGAELTNASVANVRNERLERMVMGDRRFAVYDNGFYNIGVRPTPEDVGLGGKDPFGLPLSESRLAQLGLFFDPNLLPPIHPRERVAVDGAFKTPGLRNIELTAPYFHNGGQATLLQVVEFYNRGGDFADENRADLDPDIQPLGLTSTEKSALVAFLKALTDERVRDRRAPFDHPQLFVPNGHPGDETAVFDDGTGQATDELLEIPAVGAHGGTALLPVFPHETSPIFPTGNAGWFRWRLLLGR